MMTLWRGNVCRGESTGGIHLKGTVMWNIFFCQPEQVLELTVELLLIWDAMTFVWRHCNGVDNWTYVEALRAVFSLYIYFFIFCYIFFIFWDKHLILNFHLNKQHLLESGYVSFGSRNGLGNYCLTQWLWRWLIHWWVQEKNVSKYTRVTGFLIITLFFFRPVCYQCSKSMALVLWLVHLNYINAGWINRFVSFICTCSSSTTINVSMDITMTS